MATSVTAVPAADPARAAEHFQAHLELETDCWDVHESLRTGAPDFILLDVRSVDAYAAGHIEGAICHPHRAITEASLAGYPEDTLLVVYCAGPHCNGAYKAAVRLARLGRRIKVMMGGVTGWLDEGFELVSGRGANEPLPPGASSG